MKRYRKLSIWILGSSYLLPALMLGMLPLTTHILPYWPDWLVLLSLFWVIHRQQSHGFWLIWLFTLLQDVAQGMVLGLHGLALFPALMWALLLAPRFSRGRIVQQLPWVLLFGLLESVLEFWLRGISGRPVVAMVPFFLPPFLALLLWPVAAFWTAEKGD